MNVFLLSIAIILLVCYMLYLTRRRDFNLLKKPPATIKLPRSKYEKALKELEDYRRQPPPKSRNKHIERNSQIYYLERRLEQILVETENEQKSFYLSNKEMEIAWKDYHEYFSELNLFQKLASPSNIKELVLLRNLYLEAEKKVELEIGKFNAQTRIRHHEEKARHEREVEIEEKTASEAANDIHEAFEEINTYDTEDEDIEPVENESKESPESRQTPLDLIAPVSVETPPSQDHFGQNNIEKRYPDFNGLTYIDESFSMEELELPVLQDANFDGSFFVSVLFTGRHQYKDCSFQKVEFSHSVWQRSDTPHRILNCDFTESRFNFATFDYAAFYNCRFIRTDFQETRFRTVKFVKCEFRDCNLIDVDFSHTVMSSDMLEAIDFSDCAAPPKNYLQKNEASNEDQPAESQENPET